MTVTITMTKTATTTMATTERSSNGGRRPLPLQQHHQQQHKSSRGNIMPLSKPSLRVMMIVLALTSLLWSWQICAASASSSSSSFNVSYLQLALVPKSRANPFFNASGEGCIEMAAQLTLLMQQQQQQDGSQNPSSGQPLRPVNCSYVGPELDDEDKDGTIQAQMVLRMIARREYDGIAVSVRNATVMTPVIGYAREQNVPLVTFDSDAPDSQRIAYIGTNNTFFGGQIAKVLKQLQPNGGTYALLSSQESPNFQQRVRGFQAEMARTNGKVWREVDGSPADIKSNVSIAIQLADAFASRDPPPDAIIPVMGAPMRSGGWKDFVNRHRSKDLILVSGDAMEQQVRLLERGYADGLVGQLPYEMGALAVKTLYNILVHNETPADEFIGTNVLSYLEIPLVLPPLKVDNNLIGNLRWVGFILFGIIAFLSVVFAGWTYSQRNAVVVKVAQPSFLIMVAVGVILLAAALVPLSFDDNADPNRNGDREGKVVCMSIPWLASTGFTITFSALFAKTRRVNKIFHTKTQFSRVQVSATDMALPFITLLTVNTLILAVWTALDPMTYIREDLPGLDGWNRVIATYGACRSESPAIYLAPLALINIGVLVAANWQAYEARYMESEFAESKYIAMAMASLLQAMLSGIPILFVVRESPQAYYLVTAFMIFIICSAVLLVIFVPKIVLAQTFAMRSEDSQRRLIQGAIRKQSANSDRSSVRHFNRPGQGGTSSFFSSNSASFVEEDGRGSGSGSGGGRRNSQPSLLTVPEEARSYLSSSGARPSSGECLSDNSMTPPSSIDDIPPAECAPALLKPIKNSSSSILTKTFTPYANNRKQPPREPVSTSLTDEESNLLSGSFCRADVP